MKKTDVRIVGRLLGVTLRSCRELRLEIWDWMSGQKITVCTTCFLHYRQIFSVLYSPAQALVMRAADDCTRGFYGFEFLSASSIVVARHGSLEVYQILMETPGAPLVHTVSFCMPPSRLEEYYSTALISGNSRLSHSVDCENLLSDRSFSPSPCWLRRLRILRSIGGSRDLHTNLGPNSTLLYLLFIALLPMGMPW
jgi:hypothetical protein